MDQGGDPLRGHGLIDAIRAERVGDGVGEADRRGHAVALADSLRAERSHRARRVAVEDHRIGDFASRRHRIVDEGAGQEAPVLVIDQLFMERGADGVGEGAADLTIDQGRVEATAGVVGGDVAVDGDGTGGGVDLDAAEIEDEAIGRRTVDPVVVGRRREHRRRPARGLAHGGGQARRQAARRPVGQSRDPAEVEGVIGIAGGEAQRLGRRVEPLARDPGQALPEPLGRQMRGAGHRAREAARIISGRDRPGVLLRVVFEIDCNPLRIEAERIAHDLGERGAVALALRQRVGGDGDAAQGGPRRPWRGRRRRPWGRRRGAPPRRARW